MDKIWVLYSREQGNGLGCKPHDPEIEYTTENKEKAIAKIEEIFNTKKGLGSKEWDSEDHESFTLPGMNYLTHYYIKSIELDD